MKRNDEGKRTSMTKGERDALESAILAKHAQGHLPKAAELVVQGYGPELYGYLVGILRSHDEADEAFARFSEALLKGLDSFQGRSMVRTWAYVLARKASVEAPLAPWRRRSSGRAMPRRTRTTWTAAPWSNLGFPGELPVSPG